MLSNKDILCFAANSWYSVWTSRQQVMSRLSKTNKVLYIIPPPNWSEILSGVRSKKKQKLGLDKISENLFTYVAPGYLAKNYRYKRIEGVMNRLRILHIEKTIKELDFKDIILYIWHPRFLDMVGRFGESLLCYHVHDQYSGFPGTDKSSIETQERELLSKADIVFTTSPLLYEEKREFHSNTHFVPNAVDYDLFSKAGLTDISVPPDIAQIPPPIIGYTGSINTSKVDIELLKYIAHSRPNWSIVLIGPIKGDKAKVYDMGNIKNIYLLNRKDQSDLPNYLKAFSVCLIPYVINDYTIYGYPLKLHEYLAAGKAVVSSSAVASIQEFSHVVKIAKKQSDWINYIEECLESEDPTLVEKRQAVAQENTWDKRVELISTLIEQKLDKTK